MKSSIKNLQNIQGLSNIRSYTRSIRKSGKPALPTTAILDLSMRRNERDRLIAELERTRKRGPQLQKRLVEVEKEMNKLLEAATKTAVQMRGNPAELKKPSSNPDLVFHSAKPTNKPTKGKFIMGY